MENILLVRDKKVVFKESADLCRLKQLVPKQANISEYDDTEGCPQHITEFKTNPSCRAVCRVQSI